MEQTKDVSLLIIINLNHFFMKAHLLKTGLCIFCIAFCEILFAQTSTYYQAIVYFSSGVKRNITATDTSASVTASDIQSVITKYSIGASYVYPAFPEFNERDTLAVTNVEGFVP